MLLNLQDRRMNINMKTDASTAVAMSMMLILFLYYERAFRYSRHASYIARL